MQPFWLTTFMNYIQNLNSGVAYNTQPPSTANNNLFAAGGDLHRHMLQAMMLPSISQYQYLNSGVAFSTQSPPTANNNLFAADSGRHHSELKRDLAKQTSIPGGSDLDMTMRKQKAKRQKKDE